LDSKRAYEQSSQAAQKWLEKDYPVIFSRAKQEKAEIHWGDETGIQTGANRVRGFAPKGETLVIRMVAKKSHVSMISAITNGGKVRFMMYRDAMNSELLIKFMTRLTKDAGRKVFLIFDNLPVHHGKDVKQWLEVSSETNRGFPSPLLFTRTQSGRILKRKPQEQSPFRKTSPQPRRSGEENTFIHENSSEETGSCTKLFQTSQGCLCRITKLTCSIAEVIK